MCVFLTPAEYEDGVPCRPLASHARSVTAFPVSPSPRRGAGSRRSGGPGVKIINIQARSFFFPPLGLGSPPRLSRPGGRQRGGSLSRLNSASPAGSVRALDEGSSPGWVTIRAREHRGERRGKRVNPERVLLLTQAGRDTQNGFSNQGNGDQGWL